LLGRQLEKILTMNNLRKRHVIIIEFVNHLLFHVRLIAPYGMFFSRCFRLSWVMPNQVVDLLVGGLLVEFGVLL